MRDEGGDPTRHETENERLDRNMVELLNGLRVALPGVQVLFAFLLVVPFNQGWSRLTGFERDLYYGTLLCTTLATVLLIAPVVHHRLLFRHREKHYLVMTGNTLSKIGMTTMGIAITGAVALISQVEFGDSPATAIATIAVALGIVVVWFGLPALHVRGEHKDSFEI